jgi:hypothetical protein
MSIKVWRRGECYDVLVVPDAGRGPRYRSAQPLTAIEVLTRLSELGCHPADVGEAMSAEDPGWMARLTGYVALSDLDARTAQALQG